MAFTQGISQARSEAYFRVDALIAPIREGSYRDAKTLGMAKAGDTYAIHARMKGWVQIRLSDQATGWIPETAGHTTQDSGEHPFPLGWVLGSLLGIVVGALAAFAILRWLQAWRSRQEFAKLMTLARAKRGKRLLAILPEWPDVVQVLSGDAKPMSGLLTEWGYTLQLIQAPEGILSKGRHFRPNALIVHSALAPQVEKLLAQDAALSNTPVIYLGEKPPRLSDGHGVRLHWIRGANDKSLSETLNAALKLSPKTIRHGVRTEGMRGELSGGGLWEVLHFLAVMRKSGTLTVETAKLKGEIRLAKGEILFAGMGDLADDEAVLHMLDLNQGRFAFTEMRGTSPGKGINTEKLLLNWARQRDEIEDGAGN